MTPSDFPIAYRFVAGLQGGRWQTRARMRPLQRLKRSDFKQFLERRRFPVAVFAKDEHDPVAARALLEKFGYKDRDGDGDRETPDRSSDREAITSCARGSRTAGPLARCDPLRAPESAGAHTCHSAGTRGRWPGLESARARPTKLLRGWLAKMLPRISGHAHRPFGRAWAAKRPLARVQTPRWRFALLLTSYLGLPAVSQVNGDFRFWLSSA